MYHKIGVPQGWKMEEPDLEENWELVLVVRNQGDYYFIAETEAELDKMTEVITIGQCENCGYGEEMKLDGNPRFVYCPECESVYPIHWLEAGYTIF
jgi:hypothetical protein